MSDGLKYGGEKRKCVVDDGVEERLRKGGLWDEVKDRLDRWGL